MLYGTVGLVLSFFFWRLPATAAEITLEADRTAVAADQLFQIRVWLNTEGETINTVAGNISYPTDLLNLQEIRDGNSIITFWVDRPAVQANKIFTFSGITPGGYRGPQGEILSLIFRAKKMGAPVVSFTNGTALLNDGRGSPALLKTTPLRLTIAPATGAAGAQYAIIDTNPPETFAPQIARDPNIEGNKWFVVFATQDKGAGIDHYEVGEHREKPGENSPGERAESPYILKDQTLQSFVVVKAVDKLGNQRTVILPPRATFWQRQRRYLIGILIVLFIILCGGLWSKKRRS